MLQSLLEHNGLEETLLEAKVLLQSLRLYARTWEQNDGESMYQIMSRPQMHENSIDKKLWSREDANSWVMWHVDHRIGWEIGTFNCPLILRATNQLIGHVGLNPFLQDEHIPEIEWQISPEHWGNGYATEIGYAMLGYGFQEAAFPAIMGFAVPQNQASRTVMEKIGMSFLYTKEHRGKILCFYRIERQEFPHSSLGL